MTQLRTLVVGCGNIAGRFDSVRQDGRELPLTHAGAYAKDGRFGLDACVDPDPARRAEFMAHWRVPRGYRALDEALGDGERFDVISICSPTARHADDLDAVLALKPRLVFCEKPVSGTLQATQDAVHRYRDAGVLLAVNHTRRWDPAVQALRAAIDRQEWGELRSAVGYYNKGLLNNGSHMLDLLAALLGSLRVLAVGRPVADYWVDDPSVPALLESSSGIPVQLACGHAVDYALFELQLVFAHGVIAMEDGGLFWRDRAASPSATFAGYRTLDAGSRRDGGYLRAMSNAVDNIFGAVAQARSLASTGDSALAAQRLCQQMRYP